MVREVFLSQLNFMFFSDLVSWLIMVCAQVYLKNKYLLVTSYNICPEPFSDKSAMVRGMVS